MEEQPENVHLQRQATLIHNAQVTTIHSFCLSVIRDYFHMIDLDPGFRIADEGELKLLRQDVLEEVLENCYTAGEQSFWIASKVCSRKGRQEDRGDYFAVV